jgi:hypothetical protein
MATNPKLPDYPDTAPHRAGDAHGRVQTIRQSKLPWPIVALIVGAALLIAIIAVASKKSWCEQASRGASPPVSRQQSRFLTDIKLFPHLPAMHFTST